VRAYEIRIKGYLKGAGRSDSLDLVPAKSGGDEAELLISRSQIRVAMLLE
jgi:hypothetical protein